MDCDNNFIYDSGFGFCSLFSWSSIDDPVGGESYGGPWYDLDPSYFVFKIDNGDSVGIGWVYLNPTIPSSHIISYGYQPNVEC